LLLRVKNFHRIDWFCILFSTESIDLGVVYIDEAVPGSPLEHGALTLLERYVVSLEAGNGDA
jgi:hypothetical protein